jgi:hypothetical protein
MAEQNAQQSNPTGPTNHPLPEPPCTGYASHPAAGTAPERTDLSDEPETERGGSPAPQSTSRLNEDEDGRQGAG